MSPFPYKTLVLITLDCVRPDFLGCYGCSDVQTPVLDRMASRGALFEQAITQAPNTWVSHAGLMTGLYPPLHGLRTPYDRMDPGAPTLASRLAESGFRCAGFPGNDLVGSRSGLGKGFEFYFEEYVLGDEAAHEQEGRTANNRNRWQDALHAADAWLGRQKGPAFLWFHYLDTHHLPEYDLPEFYRFSRDPSWQFYEGKISYADQCCLRSVLDLLIRHGRYEEALLVVLSDHGEELVRGGAPVHNGLLSEAVLRVPLILFGEQIPWKGLRIPNLVRTTDIFPTLMTGLPDVAGAIAESKREVGSGIPLPLPGIERMGGYEGATELAYAENEPLGLSCVRSEQWKYVTGPEGDRLFHVISDPGEQINAVDRHPSTVEHLKGALAGIRSLCPAVGERAVLEREEAETRRLLRAFGYLE
jgi:arylsulfatase A-like enzyme